MMETLQFGWDPCGYNMLFGLPIWFIIVFWGVGILLAYWVYTDAKKRRMDATVWLLITILLGIIGLIVYLIVRSEHKRR